MMTAAEQLPPLSSHLGFRLRKLSNLVSQRFSRLVEAQGVTVAEWVLLRALYDETPIAPGLLATRLGLMRGTVSKLAERLVTKDLVLREAQKPDARRQRLSLTVRGRELVPLLSQLADANDALFFGDLDPDMRRRIEDFLDDVATRHGAGLTPID